MHVKKLRCVTSISEACFNCKTTNAMSIPIFDHEFGVFGRRCHFNFNGNQRLESENRRVSFSRYEIRWKPIDDMYQSSKRGGLVKNKIPYTRLYSLSTRCFVGSSLVPVLKEMVGPDKLTLKNYIDAN